MVTLAKGRKRQGETTGEGPATPENRVQDADASRARALAALKRDPVRQRRLARLMREAEKRWPG